METYMAKSRHNKLFVHLNSALFTAERKHMPSILYRWAEDGTAKEKPKCWQNLLNEMYSITLRVSRFGILHWMPIFINFVYIIQFASLNSASVLIILVQANHFVQTIAFSLTAHTHMYSYTNWLTDSIPSIEYSVNKVNNEVCTQHLIVTNKEKYLESRALLGKNKYEMWSKNRGRKISLKQYKVIFTYVLAKKYRMTSNKRNNNKKQITNYFGTRTKRERARAEASQRDYYMRRKRHE